MGACVSLPFHVHAAHVVFFLFMGPRSAEFRVRARSCPRRAREGSIFHATARNGVSKCRREISLLNLKKKGGKMLSGRRVRTTRRLTADPPIAVGQSFFFFIRAPSRFRTCPRVRVV